MNNNRILISGGAGAIGFQLAKFLADRNDETFIVDNFIRSERDQDFLSLLKSDNVTEINVDLSDQTSYSHLPDDIDYVYHLAAFNGTQNFYNRSFQVLSHSTLPTINLIKKYGKDTRLKRFIYAGSSESYACSVTRFAWPVPTDETVPIGIDDALNPRWSYGGSKLHGEIACVAANCEFNMPFTIVRYHNIFGPRMGDSHVIPDFIDRAKEGRFELFGDKDTRSFLYVTDAVRLTTAVAESDKALNQIIHIGSEKEVKIIELAETMMKIMGRDDKIITKPSPAGSVKRRCPDISKLKSIVDFSPAYSLEQGLYETINYYAPELLANKE